MVGFQASLTKSLVATFVAILCVLVADGQQYRPPDLGTHCVDSTPTVAVAAQYI